MRMRLSRLFWQLYAGYLALILLATVVVLFVTASARRSPSRSELGNQLLDEARLLREVVGARWQSGKPLPTEGLAPVWKPKADTDLTLFDGAGRVWWATSPDEAPSASDRDRLLAVAGTVTERSTDSGARLAVALPLPGPEGEGGVLVLRREIEAAFVAERIGTELLIAALAAFVGALGLGYFLSRRVTYPLRRMTVAAAAIAGGDYHRRLRIDRTDEIGDLSKAFDGMAAQLEERVATITRDRNKLLAMFGGMIEGVIAVDRNERVVHMNTVAGRLVGAFPKASEGRFIWEVTRVRAVPEVLGKTLEAAQGRREETHVVGDRGDCILELNAAPLQDGGGQLVGAVVVLHDVTELRRLESVRRDFVANVSHELKTPVTAIRGMVETLVDDPEIDEETRQRFLGRVKDQTMRLTTLVSDLLTLARIESVHGGFELKRIDLREPIRAAEGAFAGTGLQRSVQVHLELPEEAVIVEGDPEALREATSNLLDNALKYTPAGGSIWVRLRTERHHAIIEVQDTGIGISREDQKRIFERFYRVDRARSRELGGTGLGLSIVKHVAISHGGDVTVESRQDEGSRFRIRLPILGPSV
ncbi:MAG: ATP-binding protein [Planctomycetota bacterium]